MPRETLALALQSCPLVAILRGIRPDEIVPIADTLVELGFTLIEVPLNSPDPFESIARIAKRYGGPVLVGAGTVLSVAEVALVEQAGGKLIVAPNSNPAVIAESARRRLVVLPGFATPSEAFSAIEGGATGLKLFPAEAASPMVLKAQKAVLPKEVPVLVVGGVQPADIADWIAAGAEGFGLGSGLYQPGFDPTDVAVRAAGYLATCSRPTPSR